MSDMFAKKLKTLQKSDDFLSKSQQLEAKLRSTIAPGTLAFGVTQNRHTMISVKREPGLYRVRVHHIFLEASDIIVEALGRYILVNHRASMRVLQEYIDSQNRSSQDFCRGSELRIVGRPQGEIYHLQEIYDELNHRYFENQIHAEITWGKRTRSGRHQRSIRMGSYSLEDRIIRIHPSLDRSFVPRYFVAWVVYHEMLHQKHEVPVIHGRRRFHTANFLAEEKMFDEYERARQWERTHVQRLLLY